MKDQLAKIKSRAQQSQEYQALKDTKSAISSSEGNKVKNWRLQVSRINQVVKEDFVSYYRGNLSKVTSDIKCAYQIGDLIRSNRQVIRSTVWSLNEKVWPSRSDWNGQSDQVNVKNLNVHNGQIIL